jgi:hypothetical protein
MNAPHEEKNENAIALAKSYLDRHVSPPGWYTETELNDLVELFLTTWDQSAKSRTTQIQIIFSEKINEGIHAFPIPRFNVTYPSTETLPSGDKKNDQ